jgi:hypothetical protein
MAIFFWIVFSSTLVIAGAGLAPVLAERRRHKALEA